MIVLSTALVCIVVSYMQAAYSYFHPHSLNICRERHIVRRLFFSTAFDVNDALVESSFNLLPNIFLIF